MLVRIGGYMKNKIFYLTIFIIIVLLVGTLAYLVRNVNLDNKKRLELLDLVEEIKKTDEIIITDNYDGVEKKSTATEEDTVKIINQLEKITYNSLNTSPSGNPRYTIELKSNNKLIATVMYSSSYFKINNFLPDLNDLEGTLGKTLSENYSLSIQELNKNLANTLDKITKIVVKDENNEETLKEITNKKDLKKVASIIKEAKVWEGAITLPGNINYLEFYLKDDVVITMENNGNYTLKYQNVNYILDSFSNEELEEILNG